MSEKITPLPWTAFRESKEKLWRISVDPAPTICTFAVQHGFVGRDKANAVYAAKAANAYPKLVQIARAYIELADYVGSGGLDDIGLPGLSDALNKARAILAESTDPPALRQMFDNAVEAVTEYERREAKP